MSQNSPDTPKIPWQAWVIVTILVAAIPVIPQIIAAFRQPSNNSTSESSPSPSASSTTPSLLPDPPTPTPDPKPSPTPTPKPLETNVVAYLSDFLVRPETRAQVSTERDKSVTIAGEAFERGTIVRICPGLWAGTGARCREPVEWDLAQKYNKLTGRLGPADASENQGGRWIVTFYGIYGNNKWRELYRKTIEAGTFAEDIGSIDLTGVRRLQVLIEGTPSGSLVLANMRLDSATGTMQ